MSTPDPNHPPPSGSLAGCALFTIGLLLVVPSGLCTAIGGIGLLMELANNPRDLAGELSVFVGLAVVTLGCLATGILLIRTAMKARRR